MSALTAAQSPPSPNVQIMNPLQLLTPEGILTGESGAARLRAAISAREAGLSVCILSKGSPGKSTCTELSGGVMAGSSGADQRDLHLQRTLMAGRGLNDRRLVEILVNEAPLRLRELTNWGIRGDLRERHLYGTKTAMRCRAHLNALKSFPRCRARSSNQASSFFGG